jgi:hypothetical protein
MSRENPLWSAPRIHGELLKLGIVLSENDERRERSDGDRECETKHGNQ